MFIIDAHEDIAWNMAVLGRDYTRSVAWNRAREAGSDLPASVGQAMLGWPDWQAGQVAVVFATLYAAPCRHSLGPSRVRCYSSPQEAHQLYQAQLHLYHRLTRRYPDRFYLITSAADLSAGLAEWQASPPETRRLGLVILMEGADAIRHPDEVSDWYAAGVRIIGPAWAGTQYAGGTGEPGPFTAAGRSLLRQMAARQMILDLSHLAEEAVREALDSYPGPIIASHSNARALLPDNHPDRHLSDQTIRHLAERGGVIGVVLPIDFLKNGVRLGDPRQQVTLDDVVRHIDYLCQCTGSARYVGLGSDLDGGFGLEHSPVGIDSIADLPRIGDALVRRGYSPADIAAIMGGNWRSFLEENLPA
ncbi:MAG: peptidase M19 [Chloroflexi bacterium]|nr:MAG: peptidase M19 [Chloroflexota bacterium]